MSELDRRRFLKSGTSRVGDFDPRTKLTGLRYQGKNHTISTKGLNQIRSSIEPRT